MTINLPSAVQITNSKNGKVLNTDKIVVNRVIDNPTHKNVVAVIKGAGKVKVDALCGSNYDNPQWSNETLAAALSSQFTS